MIEEPPGCPAVWGRVDRAAEYRHVFTQFPQPRALAIGRKELPPGIVWERRVDGDVEAPLPEAPGERRDPGLRCPDLRREVMREEDDPQAASVERERVAGRFAGFAADGRTQRAWEEANAGNRALRHELSEAVLPLLPEGPLIDVGCGSGWWLRTCAQVDARRELAGLEIQEVRVAMAREAVPGADIRFGDARELPWPDGRFAVTTLFLVLSSLADRGAADAALAEAARVTRDDGLVIVWEPRWPSPRRRRMTVSRGRVRRALGPVALQRTITLLPPLARRCSAESYARLTKIAPLRSHYLLAAGPR